MNHSEDCCCSDCDKNTETVYDTKVTPHISGCECHDCVATGKNIIVAGVVSTSHCICMICTNRRLIESGVLIESTFKPFLKETWLDGEVRRQKIKWLEMKIASNEDFIKVTDEKIRRMNRQHEHREDVEYYIGYLECLKSFNAQFKDDILRLGEEK